MALEVYKIELKVDGTPEVHEAMTAIIQQAAKGLLSGAMLLSPNKPPQIMCVAADRFYEEREIELFDGG